MPDQSSLESNLLLRAFPPLLRERTLSRSQLVKFAPGAVVQHSNQPLHYVYFPRIGIISQMIDMQDGGMVEVGIVGNEGALGLGVATGNLSQRVRSLVTLPVVAVRVPVKHMQSILIAAPDLRQLLVDYLIATAEDAQQLTACGVLHELESRVSRWLLQAFDRNPESSVAVTQEMLAERLGVHRTSINFACGALAEAGLIDGPRRGCIRVIDHERLKGRACECYSLRRGGAQVQ